MNNATRRAINTLVDDIDYLEVVLKDEEYLLQSTTNKFKEEFSKLVEQIVCQEAEYKKNQILEKGYMDEVIRIRKKLGVAGETERKA